MTTSGPDREPAAEPDNRPNRPSGECAMSPDFPVPGFQEPENREFLENRDILTDRDRCLQEFEKHSSIIRDRLQGVCKGFSHGLYIHGPPGVSKTHTAVTFLKANSIPFKHVLGHLTGSGLFDILEENPTGIIVLDDVSALFKNDDKGVQLLLAALGSSSDGSRVRRVTYRTALGERVVEFTGGIVAISNLGLEEHRNDVIQALADRVHVMKFDPTPEQVEAMIHKIAKEGPAGVAAEDAVMVAAFLTEECQKRGIRLTIRMFVDKALPDFRMWKAEKAENHWKDLVRASVAGELVPQKQAVRNISRRDRTAADQQTVQAICKEFATPKEKLRAWEERTGNSPSKFYCIQKQLKDSGQLSWH